jgi:23S rRNA (guanosine2251-2'-O)-methyltransferase
VIAVRSALPVLSFKKIVEESEDNMMLIYIRESFNEYNIGSIIRTAECTGASAVILSPKTKITPQVIRASMGASENVSIVHEGLFTAIKVCKDAGVKVIGIEVTGDNFYHEADLTGRVMFIIGGEDRSLSDEIVNKCDEVVKIPLEGQINSLNMSVATGVVMYDKLRQDGMEM